MQINEYVQAAKSTNKVTLESHPETAIHHQMLGLIGEVGELAEKLKKFERDVAPLTQLNHEYDYRDAGKHYYENTYTHKEQRQLIEKELGDIFWYLCVLADMLEFDIENILQTNLDKLAKRYQENKIGGSGDER